MARLRIERLERDAAIAEPTPNRWVDIDSPQLDEGLDPSSCAFSREAQLIVPSLLDLPARSNGDFTEFAIDVLSPHFPSHPDHVCELDLTLRGRVLETCVFRNFTQRHQLIVPISALFEEHNALKLTARMTKGDATPQFRLRVCYLQRERIHHQLAESSVFVFSTARSGSTWLSQDLLCWDGRSRPMDEPGLGKMFAPIDWDAERFYRLPDRPTHFESGLDYELREKHRSNLSVIPPFERAFLYASRENQIWNAQNWRMYLALLRETAIRHVINEWGVIDYQRVIFKLPNESHAADVIMQSFPESFMIFLMRDGRDVMRSRFSPFASLGLAETNDPELRRYAIAFYSHLWNFQVDVMLSAFEAHAPDRRLLVHYEDLRRQPLENIRMLFLRLGIPLSDAELVALTEKTRLENIPPDQKGPDKPRQEGAIGGYLTAFSPPEIALMEAIMGENLRAFGYDVQ